MNKELIEELVKAGVAFTDEDIIFITRDATGQIVWLEKGNERAGLVHIVERHMDDFSKALGLTEEKLPRFLEEVVTKGTVVSNTTSDLRTGYSRVYDFDGNYYTVTAIGTNGFIVTAYPTPKEV